MSAGIAAAILAVFIPSGCVESQSEVKVPRSVLEQYEGLWVYPTGNTFMITLEGDTLFRETSGRRLPLIPMSQTRFAAGPVFTAEFVIDKNGGITQILSDGVGTEYRLTRKGSPPAVIADREPAVRVPTTVLQRYVGEYEYLPGQMSRTDLKVVVRLKGDTLLRFIGGPKEDVLIPLSMNRFRIANTSLVTEFVIDSTGAVTQIMGSGDQQMKARLKTKF